MTLRKKLIDLMRDPPFEIIYGVNVRRWLGLSRLDAEAIADEIVKRILKGKKCK